MAMIPGGDRKDNRALLEGVSKPAVRGPLDALQEAKKSRNATVADAQRISPGPNPGTVSSSQTNIGQPFKVRVGG